MIDDDDDPRPTLGLITTALFSPRRLPTRGGPRLAARMALWQARHWRLSGDAANARAWLLTAAGHRRMAASGEAWPWDR